MSHFTCNVCGISFEKLYQLSKHKRIKHDNKVFKYRELNNILKCSLCAREFNNLNKVIKHLKKCQVFVNNYKCNICQNIYLHKSSLIRHSLKCISQYGTGKFNRLPKLKEDSKFHISKTAFKAFLQQYELFPDQSFNDVSEFLTHYKNEIFEMIKNILNTLDSIKIQFCLSVTFSRETEGVKIYTIGYFCTENFVITIFRHMKEQYKNIIDILDKNVNEFEQKGSNWKIEEIDRLDLRIGIYNPFSGGCHTFLPEEVKNKHAIINIKNNDERCFLYSVIAGLYPPKFNPSRVNYYKTQEYKFNLKDIQFPVSEKIIDKFEKNNQHLKININIYEWSNFETRQSTLKPIRISKYKNEKIINLLLYKEHYFYIKNFNRLVGNLKPYYHHYCLRCFSGFHSAEYLKKHSEKCLIFKPSVAILPNENNNILSFKEIDKIMRFPFVCYADFESVLINVNKKISNKTKIVQQHEPSGYSLIVIKNRSEIYHHSFYRGEGCIEEFFKILKQVVTEIKTILCDTNDMIELTREEKREYKSASKCYLCKKDFTGIPDQFGFTDIKVRDHCHLTGKYRGPTHQSCNMNYQIPKKIPLFFHNLRGYDSHLIIRCLKNEHFKKCEIIPQNMERFIAFTLDDIQVLDSYQFLSESLEKLVTNLRNSDYNFPITTTVFKNYIDNSRKKQILLFQKSIYPYEYITSFDKFDETELPSKSCFYSNLNKEDISDKDYNHAKIIWKEFNIKNIGQYHDFYMNLDTTLLADVFQAFRQKILDVYELDPCHFYSIPGLAWTSALKYTKVELELFTDVDMYQFIELGLRGGMSGVSKRFSKANNPMMPDFDEKKETIYLTYLDCNNLYGFAMDSYLPQKEFKWLDEKEYDFINWKTVNTETESGYILEIDLHYPQLLHDLHKDLPLAPEKRKVTYNELSNYQKHTLELLKKYGYRRTATEKLMSTLYDKYNYIIHFKNLKLYLKLGLELIKIHKVLGFKQSKFLSPYIKLNTNLRKKAKNDFEKDLYKLMNNSVFGKSIQDQRKHIDVRLALNEQKAKKWLIKPNFDTFNILDEEKVLIKMKKTVVKLNKPVYIGFTVLEFSKAHMFELHYNIFKKYYEEDINLVYTDTDSLLYEIKTDNFYEDLEKVFSGIMDFSNYPKNNKLFNENHKKIAGYLKDELGGLNLAEFIGLKSKLYSFKYAAEKNKVTAKGLQKQILKKFINHDHYKKVLFKNNIFCTKMMRIRSKDHQLQTIELSKTIFTPMDDKKYILEDGVHCVPFGYNFKNCNYFLIFTHSH